MTRAVCEGCLGVCVLIYMQIAFTRKKLIIEKIARTPEAKRRGREERCSLFTQPTIPASPHPPCRLSSCCPLLLISVVTSPPALPT